MNIHAIVSSNPEFWTPARTALLQKILVCMGPKHTLSRDQLEAFIQREHGRHPPRAWLKRLASVLEELKDGHGLDVVVPPVPITFPRPSVLPASAEEFSWLEGCRALQDVFWDEWIPKHAETGNNKARRESLVFGLAFVLASEVGMHALQVTDALASLKVSDILDGGRRIRLKVHPRDHLDRHAMLGVPTSATLFLHALLQQTANGYLISGSNRANLKQRREKVRTLLYRGFHSLKSLVESRNPGTILPPNWPSFCRVAHLLPFYEGLEPFLISAVRRYPLPVAHPESSPLPLRHEDLVPGNPSPLVLGGAFQSRSSTPRSGSWSPPRANTSRKDDWCGRSKTVLRHLIRQLQTVASQKIRTAQQKQRAIGLIDAALRKADALAPGKTSALHLALLWMREYLQKHDITASTIEAYFQRAFLRGLLDFADSDDLSGWDAEDHELAIESILARPRLSEKSKKDIVDVLKRVYSFAVRNSFCPGVSVNFAAEGWTASTTRPEVIGLHHFDAVVQALEQRSTRHDLEKAAALILGFYGGLRSGEAARLTLDDIVILEGELYIEITRSKTAAGRRRIPLHLLAPDYACQTVSQVYENRFNEFKEKSQSRQLILRNIPLFGPEKLRERYVDRSLAQSCIAELRWHLGQSFVYHSLRHSFASWLLVRWYAARYPDFLEMLAEKHHPIFSPSCQQNLTQLFASEAPGAIPAHHTSDLVVISKLLGHSGQETLFSTYIHTFHLIHEHAMQRMSACFGNRRLKGKTISAIVPGMKSRHSHQKLPGRTINEICEFLDHQISRKPSAGCQS